MSKNYLILFLLILFSGTTLAKNQVYCKAVTGTVTQCNPYSFKFLRAKKLKYGKNRQKLIVKKTLPIPPKPKEKVTSVLDMIDKYVEIDEPVRYRGVEEVVVESNTTDKKEPDQSLAEEINIRRLALIEKMEKLYKEQELKRIEGLELAEKMENERLEKLKLKEEKVTKKVGIYIIESGDSLSGIAEMFKMKTSKLIEINDLKKNVPIRIGKKLIIPYDQEIIDIISKAEYIVKKGDNFSSIAKEFNLTSSDIVKYNKLKKDSKIRVGQTLYLPFPYKLAQEKRKKKLLAKKEALKKKNAKKKKSKMVKGFGNRRLRVTATAYSSHHSQTDKTPFLAAWNNRIRPGMKIIAVSRDMLTRYGLRNGSKVKIGGLSGYYTVRDKMNKRYKKRIDIYMGVNRRRALRWGRRSVMLYY
jgi:LysM repeat protein